MIFNVKSRRGRVKLTSSNALMLKCVCGMMNLGVEWSLRFRFLSNVV